MVVKKERRCRRKARKQGKPQHNHRPPLAALSEVPDEGVAKSRRQTARDAHKPVQRGHAGRRFYDKCRADQRQNHRYPLHRVGLLLEDNVRHRNGEEGRELVEHAGVGDVQMVRRIKVTQDSAGAEEASRQQPRDAPFLNAESLLAAKQKHKRHKHRDDVSEERLLNRRQVPRHPDKKRHQGKAEARPDNKQNSLFFVLVHRYSSFVK